MNWEAISAAYLGDSSRRYVLVSLVEKKGSSYLQPGARMLVRDDGTNWGSISAGCLEESIAELALECLRTGKHRITEIDTRPFFGCFGQISVLLEVLPECDSTSELFVSVRNKLKRRATFNVVTDYNDLSAEKLTKLGQARASDNCLLEQVQPPPRILVFGDWPDGQALVRIAKVMGWDVSAFDASEPGFTIERATSGIAPDSMTAAVVMTHNFAKDILCLSSLLRLPLGYVGLIGSRKRRVEVSNEILEDADMELIEALDRLHCPAGLDLGGEGHEAIALSVVAEIQSAFMKHNAAPLKEKIEAIHKETL